MPISASGWKRSLTNVMATTNQNIPDWVTSTPNPYQYCLQIEIEPDGLVVDPIELTREEYIGLKHALARMRGIPVPDAQKPESVDVRPEQQRTVTTDVREERREKCLADLQERISTLE